jgi:hypothetical protein
MYITAAKTSPIDAAFVITEGINEAKDNGKTVSITTLDAEKAFDKLVHNILFRKLYHYNIDDDAWIVIRTRMLDTKEVIRIHKSKTDGQQMSRGNRKNKDLQKSSPNFDKYL